MADRWTRRLPDRRRAGLPAPQAQDIAFLQYTSGSTSDPKGVAVTPCQSAGEPGDDPRFARQHQAIHLRQLGAALSRHGIDPERAARALYVGALCVLMAPNAFMQRPLNWLRAIHRYRAEVGCSPNFGYDLCVSRYRADQMDGIDLSSWKVALNGAEPVHADTIKRFSETFAGHGFDPDAAFPAYGMAEATLLIAGGSARRGPRYPRCQPHRSAEPRRRRAGGSGRSANPRGLRPGAGRRADRDRRSRQPPPPAV